LTEPLDPDAATGFLVVRAHHLLARRFHETLAEVGLTPAQFGVLTALARDEHVSQGSLARTTLVTAQAPGQMLRALVDRGLVERLDDVGRVRGYRVRLTDHGRRKLDVATPLIAQMNTPSNLGLSEDQAEHLGRLLHRVLEAQGTKS